MTIRSLDFLDLPSLPRYRLDILPLDTARLLTRGNPLGATALLSYLNPRLHLYTAVSSEGDASLMGQVTLNEGEYSARLTFLTPADKVVALGQPLLDHLNHQAGEWGAQYVLAEVDEDSPSFHVLRKAGFAMFAWQRAWKLPVMQVDAGEAGSWRPADEADWLAMQSLHAQIIPILLAPVEVLSRQAAGWVCFGEGGLQACALISSGLNGVWIQPLALPDSPCFIGQIHTLVRSLGSEEKRGIFVCVRSYQTWLEASLQEIGAQPYARQAVMVKRLAVPIKSAQAVNAMEKVLGKAKPAAPAADRVEPAAGKGTNLP
jgi:hypothetical protein